MVSRSVARSILTLLLSLIAYESTYAQIPTRQFAMVEVSEFIGTGGPTSATSDAIGSFDLVAGTSGLEAEIFITESPFPSLRGVDGSLFLQANSLDVPQSSAMARFEYEFLLSQAAELAVLRFGLPFEKGANAEVSFLLERDGSPIFSSSGEPLSIFNSDLAPGLYNLTVEASAFASSTIVLGFDSAQVDFALFVNTVPEPGTATLAITTLGLFGIGRRRRKQA